MNEMRGHIGLDHPLARYFKGHVIPGDAEDGPRWITEFDGVGVYGEFEETTVSGDFRLALPINIFDASTWSTLISGPLCRLTVVSSTDGGLPLGVVFNLSGSGPVATPANSVTVGLTSTVELIRVDDRISIAVDEVELAAASGPQYAVPITFKCFGKNVSHIGSNDWLDGCYPAPVSLHDAGTLVGLYKLDRTDGVLRNYAPSGALEAETCDLSTWVYENGGSYDPATGIISIDTSGNDGELVVAKKSGQLNNNQASLIAYEVIETTGNLRLNHNGDGQTNEVANAAVGARAVLFMSNGLGDGQLQIRVAPDVVAKVRLVSVKRADGWGQMHNLAADSVQRHRRADDGNLVSSNNMILASPLYKLNQQIKRHTTNKAGKVRPIARFDGVAMFGEFPEWTANNYRIRIVHRRRSGGMTVNERLLASSGPDSIFLNTSGRLAVKLTMASDGSASYATSSVDHTGDELIESTVIKLGNKVLTGLNGEILDVYDRAGLAPIVLSMVSNSSFYEGEFMLFSLEDLDDPLINSRLYLMDSDTGILYDALAEKGPELISRNASDWVENNASVAISGNTIRVTNTTNDRGVAYMPMGLVAGDRITVAIGGRTGSGEAWVYNPFASLPPNSVKQVDLADAGFLAIRANSYTAGDYVEFELPSVRETPNAGQIHNAPADAYPQFVYQGGQAKEWLSPELSDQSEAKLPAEYLGGPYGYWDLCELHAGRKYRVGAYIEENTTGLVAGFGSATGIPPSIPFRRAIGTVGGDYIANGTGNARVYCNASEGRISLTGITAREVLKEAH